MTCRKAFFVLTFILVFGFAKTWGDEALSFYLENDSRFTKPNGNTDRHYTNGARIVYVTQPEWNWLKE